MNVNRLERINEEIKRKLSELIQQEVKDPRVSGMITVTFARTTQDLKICKVGVSIYGGNTEENEQTFKRLQAIKGFLRTRLAQELDLRSTPEILFQRDTGIDESEHIEKLLAQINEKEGKQLDV